MIILGIETSCDETALSIIEINDDTSGSTEVKIIANEILSQIALHKQYGGVFPMVAKREHAKNLVPLFRKIIAESNFLESRITNHELKSGLQNHSHILKNVRMILEREPELLKRFLEFIPTMGKPPTRPVRNRECSQRDSAYNGIDLIAVTAGPGLEPCLWTGINFAKALSLAWHIPVVATNHMEGHILVSLLKRNEELSIINYQLSIPEFPALALLISGGHTELVLIKEWLNYEIVGRTRDDALGEAFDKVARILGLPYPGGPAISALAEKQRQLGGEASKLALPRPMLHSNNLDFSFSGLKTAVLYLVKKLPAPIDEKTKAEIAREFEDAATEVVVEKVKKAIKLYGVETLILGGGVVANKNIRRAFEKLANESGIALKLPAIDHTTDNALMIVLAGYFNRNNAVTETSGLLELKANGNLSFPYTKM